jgi:hypothetical protein
MVRPQTGAGWRRYGQEDSQAARRPSKDARRP